MKKFYYLFSLATVIMLVASCNKKDNNTATPVSYILPKKVIEFDTTGTKIKGTATFSYERNKIKTMRSDDVYANFYYSGDLISKIEVFNSNTNLLMLSHNLVYKDNNLNIVYYNEYDSLGQTLKSSDTTFFSYENSKIIAKEGNITTTYTMDANSNIVSSKFTDKNNITRETNYEYDTKNNAFKNVLGFNKLIDFIDITQHQTNNILKKNRKEGGQTIYTYEYNAKFYPVIIKRYVTAGYWGKKTIMEEWTKIEY